MSNQKQQAYFMPDCGDDCSPQGCPQGTKGECETGESSSPCIRKLYKDFATCCSKECAGTRLDEDGIRNCECKSKGSSQNQCSGTLPRPWGSKRKFIPPGQKGVPQSGWPAGCRCCEGEDIQGCGPVDKPAYEDCDNACGTLYEAAKAGDKTAIKAMKSVPNCETSSRRPHKKNALNQPCGSSSDCQSGNCQNGKCAVGGSGPSPGPSPGPGPSGSSSSHKMSGGEIAAIVVGSVAGLALIVIIVMTIARARK